MKVIHFTLNLTFLIFKLFVYNVPHFFPFFLIPYSLFPIPYSLFPIPYFLFPIPYSLFPIPYSLFRVLNQTVHAWS